MNFDEIMQGFSESASETILEYTRLYFKKEPHELTKSENDHIDSIGIDGCIEWLEAEDKKLRINFEIIDRYSVDLLKENPEKIYIFGDNMQGWGKGGQAIIRDEPNALGIPTKRAPNNTSSAFFSDRKDEEEAIRKALVTLEKYRLSGRTVVLPKDGIGTGLANMNEKSPKLFKRLTTYLQRYCPEYLYKADNHNSSADLTTINKNKKEIHMTAKNYKYNLTSETKTLETGEKLFRIQATKDFGDVKEGQKGGWVESFENLSHDGNAWLYDDAMAINKAIVSQDATLRDASVAKDASTVSGECRFSGNATIQNNARALVNVKAKDNAIIADDVVMAGNATIKGNARALKNAFVAGNFVLSGDAVARDHANCIEEGSATDYALVKGRGTVCGYAVVKGHGRVEENGRVQEQATVQDKALVSGTGVIKDNAVANDNAVIKDSAVVGGSVWITEDVEVSGLVQIEGSDILSGDDVYNGEENNDDLIQSNTLFGEMER